jgi:serine/threonine-protein kinase
MQFESGMRITNNIQLRGMLGEGGTGEIWAAEHLLLRRPVAIKRLALQFADNVEARQQFAAEARAAARLESANVTRVFDYALLPDGTPFIVMELLEGTELYARVRDGQTIPLEETTQIVLQMCAALTSIHDAGIVHRDVKPENIFLVPKRGGGFTVKLFDFGIAKVSSAADCDERAKTGLSLLGTPAYMSPEQLEDAGTVDARADLWSLAIVVYCCLTGGIPFGGDNLAAIEVAIRLGAFTLPTALKPELPSALDGWFSKALNPNCCARFGTSTEMAEAFVAAAKRTPAWVGERPRLELVMTPAATKVPVATPRPSRRNAVAVLTAVAALTAMVAALQREWDPRWSAVPVGRAISSVLHVAHAIPAFGAAGQ